MLWCVSRKDFETATKFDEGQKVIPDHIDMKILAICDNIISISCKILTPITFGLGVKLHHDFGSRDLIQDLYSLGHCIHYDEMRKFLTAASDNEIKAQSQTGIPGGISLYDPSNINSIVDAAIDNFDQNEETINGKNTTHAMAIVLYQRIDSSQETTIEKTGNRTLDLEVYDETEIQWYNKPRHKPEPAVSWEVQMFGKIVNL